MEEEGKQWTEHIPVHYNLPNGPPSSAYPTNLHLPNFTDNANLFNPNGDYHHFSMQYQQPPPQNFFPHQPLPNPSYQRPESWSHNNNPFSTHHQRTPSFGTQHESDAFTPGPSTPDTCYSQCSDALPCTEPNCEQSGHEIVECTEPTCAVGNLSCGDDMPASAVQVATYLQSAPLESAPNQSPHFAYTWPEFGNPDQQYFAFNPADMGASADMSLENFNFMGNTSAAFHNPSNHLMSNSPLPSSPMEPYHGDFGAIPDHRQKRRRGADGLVVDAFSTMSPTYMAPSSPVYDPATCRWQGCNREFESRISRDEHVHGLHYHPQLTLQCPHDDCTDDLGGIPLPTHLKRKHGDMMPDDSCSYPDCSFVTDGNENLGLEQHVDQKHSMPVASGLLCKYDNCNTKDLETSQELAEHLSDKHDVRIYETNECRWKAEDTICGRRFKSPKELQEHTKTAHLADLSTRVGYHCRWEGCERLVKLGINKPFSQRGKLERHMQSHTKYKAATCSICKNEFSGEQSLEQHMRIHSGDKPFVCDYENCDKKFAQASALTMHKRTHTGDKPLKCEYCNKSFAESSNLSKHRKTHNEVGKYACDEAGCVKTFHREEQLRKHKAQHAKKGF